jgi:hypothetical protein
MPTEPADTSVLRLQDQHRSDDVFASTISIFCFNIFLIYLSLKVLYMYVLIS